MTPDVTLGALVSRGSDVWFVSNHSQLLAAFRASGNQGAVHLKEFCNAVESWLGAPPVAGQTRLQRKEWIERVADRFLGSLTDRDLLTAVDAIPALDDQLDLAAVLGNRSSTRQQMRPLLLHLFVRFGAEVPKQEPPAGGEVEEWTSRWLRLLSLQGSLVRDVAGLTTLLDGAPEWLIEHGLLALGKVGLYDNFYELLAKAVAASANPQMPRAIAGALQAGGSLRLAELLEVIARASAKRGDDGEAERRLTGSVEMALVARTAGELGDRFRRFADSSRLHSDDLQQLFAAYLNAVPSNHEEAFDFLTRHGTRPRGRALSDWGGVSVSTWMTGSMRSTSIHYQGPRMVDGPSPDFDVSVIAKRLTLKSALSLIYDQMLPDFAFDYLGFLHAHPLFEEIACAVVGNEQLVQRWQAAEGTHAVAVWDGLERLVRNSPSFNRLREKLQPVLLPRMPTEYLGVQRLFQLPEVLRPRLVEILSQRLAATTDIRELERIIDATDAVELQERANILSLVAPARFALTGHAGEEEVREWLYCLVRLSNVQPDVVREILAHLSLDHALSLLNNHEAFGVSEHDNQGFLVKRLMFKAALVARLGGGDRTSIAMALEQNLKRDFTMFFWAGVRLPIWRRGIADDNPETVGDLWLDIVAEYGSPTLVNSYLVSVVHNGFAAQGAAFEQAFSVVAEWVAAWLRVRRLTAPEDLWVEVEQRVRLATEVGDVEQASVFAAVAAPGESAHVRRFRENCLSMIQDALRRGHRPPPNCRPWRDLRTLIAVAAPDLLERMN